MTLLSANTNALTQALVFSTDIDPLRVLADSPPFISGYKPLPNDVAGVNRNMVNSDRRGLLGYILPYFNMSSTDRARVYIGTSPAPVANVEIGPYVNQLVPFHLPATVLEQRYASPVPIPTPQPLYFSIQRISENEKNSPPLSLLYKPFGPGERDTRPDLPNNQGLALPIPSETVIDKTVIDNGMFVTVRQYEHQAIGDTVYLAVGPLVLTMPVTALGDLLFELTPDFLATLPNTDKLALSYEIWDIVENGSGWSSAIKLTLKPTAVLLAAPVVDEADAQDNVDHGALAGGTATVLLTGLFSAGDRVVLTLIMLTLAGDRVERTMARDVTTSSRSLRFTLENGYVQNAIRGSIVLSYTQQSAGTTRFSKSCTITVSGLLLPAAPPGIDEQEGEFLPFETSVAHVRIPAYWPLTTGATVQLFWQVTGPNGVVHLYIFGQVINDVAQEIVFTVASEYIERFAGSPLTVLYKIENPGKAIVQSQSLQIDIGESTLIQDITDFNDRTFNGWERGPAANERDLSIRLAQGSPSDYVLYNNTFTNSSAGVLLKKTFPNLKVGATYQFRISAQRANQQYDAPILRLSTSQEEASPAVTLSVQWVDLSLSFTARTKTIELRINSDQPSGLGNDYEIDNITLRIQ